MVSLLRHTELLWRLPLPARYNSQMYGVWIERAFLNLSFVCLQHLANPKSKILAILGCGVEARSHYKAMTLIQSFEEVKQRHR